MMKDMSGRSEFHYTLEWDDGGGTKQTFEFKQSENPFTHPDDANSLTMAKWDGVDVLNDPLFLAALRYVRKTIFKWLTKKFPDEFSMGSGRQKLDNFQVNDDDVDSSFSNSILIINLVPEIVFNPKFVEFYADFESKYTLFCYSRFS